MDIKEIGRNWDEWGRIDPFRAILTAPEKKGNRWQPDEFFETGLVEVEAIVKYVESLGSRLPRRKALDFGCGVGRLTQAMARYFDEVYGVDIAPSMIKLANKYNRHGKRCKYYLNETGDLKIFTDSSFGFIYSNITLQHTEPRYSAQYISEFLRILVADGVLILYCRVIRCFNKGMNRSRTHMTGSK